MEPRTPHDVHQSSQSRPLLFISHLTEDRQVANVLTSFIRNHSGGRVQVFQTSTDGAQPSRLQRRDIMEALWAANLVVLVFTDGTADWSYCMWECDVASHAPNPARLIVLMEGNTFPASFANEVRISARDRSDLRHFVNGLLTSTEFFPGHNQALTMLRPNSPEIIGAADDLYADLSAALDRRIDIFISYRRRDTAPYARLLREELSKRFGPSRVFMDVESISGSVDFVEEIERAVGACKLLIALIGPHWSSITDTEGYRRLDDPTDNVRLEIETALTSGIPVMPVLVDNTSMPRPQQLPESLAPMTRRNALELTYNRYSDDLSHLLKEVERILARTAAAPPPVP
jgi:TIR domain